jgi:gliding motility-associated-like protein
LPYVWNGTTVNAGGTHIAQYITASTITGCDSTTILDLVVMPAATTLTIDTIGCGSVVFEGRTYLHNDTFKDTISNQHGCDSIYRTVNIIIRNETPEYKTIDTFACDALHFEGQTYYGDTTLYDQFITMYGCDSLHRTVNITIEHFELKLTMEPEQPYASELLQFKTDADVDYEVLSWWPEVWFDKQHLKEQSVIARQTETVVVAAQSEHDCIDSAMITVDVLPLSYRIFVPNVFSPNGDGLNDYFAPQLTMQRAYTISQFQIFDRWGKAVYNSMGNDARWDGNYVNGQPADVGTYQYRIVVKFADGKLEQLKGDVVLVR